VFKQFEEIVGFKYLKGMHLNDSKKGLNSKLDRHCNIGKGEIGLECFKFILNDKRFNNIPLILETEGPFDKEIELLESLID
jgi:endonuclease IV